MRVFDSMRAALFGKATIAMGCRYHDNKMFQSESSRMYVLLK